MEIERDPTHQETKRTNKTHQTPIPSQQASDPFPDLPHEIITEILARLPVKSLLQFRSVCKSWLSLISNPHFVKSHLSLAYKSDDYTHRRLVLSCVRPHFDLKSCTLGSILNDQSDTAVDLDYPLRAPHNSVWIVGSCNGLVCIAIEEDAVFLWNPTTRKSNRLPDSGVRMRYGCFIIYGFGYDLCSDDYKVVVIFCVLRSGGSYETEVKVYSLRTDTWRRIGDFCHGIPLNDSGRYLSGSLHWSASGVQGSSYSWDIVSLDLANEVYGKVVLPNCGEGRFDSTLEILRGCLCVLCNFPGTRSDIWVMKEYGQTESWTKLFSIPHITNLWDYEHSTLLYLSRNGEVLLQLGPQLVLCNPRDGTFKNIVIHNLLAWLEAHIYVESLVSPNTEM
ncbi:hypothetical protein RHMOL_Rhmol09G0065500 [Rhododendron molle]|uniref:Uncharacterized protein n=1 Tax=Rhododendron molle TaxID=49168 RepID=A0ACC0MBQ5_RHOML|nr:hypothetical protein RHMOL_Rhmol09G0065500 [Rhododendron molle]